MFAGALLLVIESLQQYGSSAEIAAKTTELFGRVGGFAIQTLTNNYSELIENIKTANDEMDNGMSLLKETAVQSDTTASQWKMFVNEWKEGIVKQSAWLKTVVKGMRAEQKQLNLLREDLSAIVY